MWNKNWFLCIWNLLSLILVCPFLLKLMLQFYWILHYMLTPHHLLQTPLLKTTHSLFLIWVCCKFSSFLFCNILYLISLSPWFKNRYNEKCLLAWSPKVSCTDIKSYFLWSIRWWIDSVAVNQVLFVIFANFIHQLCWHIFDFIIS